MWTSANATEARARAEPSSIRTFGAGTIIDGRNGSPSPPCGSSPGSPDPREPRRHRAPPTTRHLRATPPRFPLPATRCQDPLRSAPACASAWVQVLSDCLRRHPPPRRTDRRHGVKYISALEDFTQSPTPLLTDSPNRADISLDPMLSRLSTTNRSEPVLARTRLGSLRQCLLRGHCPGYTSMNNAGS